MIKITLKNVVTYPVIIDADNGVQKTLLPDKEEIVGEEISNSFRNRELIRTGMLNTVKKEDVEEKSTLIEISKKVKGTSNKHD